MNQETKKPQSTKQKILMFVAIAGMSIVTANYLFDLKTLF